MLTLLFVVQFLEAQVLMMYQTIWGRERMKIEDQNDNNLWSLYGLIYEYIQSCQV